MGDLACRKWMNEGVSQAVRLVVQIPCLNEEETLPQTVADIRVALEDFSHVILVIDDGSTDGTVDAARRAGVDYLARLPRHSGLSRAFMTGISASLRLGADIIVNTDADNQYQAGDIEKLIAPIVSKRADIVIGARPIAHIEHFSGVKKFLQKAGSGAIKWLTNADVMDATSGFRAISRDAALRLNVFTPFTYTLETIIQGARSGMKIVSVPIGVRPPTRPSRLFRSIWQYLKRSATHILGIYTVYAPLRTYGALGLVPFALATVLGLRYLLLITFADPTRSHTPSLVLAAILFVLAFILWAVGGLGELIAVNRRLLEDIQTEQRRARLRSGQAFDLDDNYELVALKKGTSDVSVPS